MALTIIAIINRKNKLSKYFLLPLVLIIISIPIFRDSFAFNLFNNKKEGVKVLSWNVKNFDLYNWSKNAESRTKMLNLIKDENADILCFQEFFEDNKNMNNIEALTKMGYVHSYFAPFFTNAKGKNKWGLAIFSKYPISGKENLNINPNKKRLNQCIKAEINSPKGTFEVYNAHFQSLHLDYSDYNFLDSITKKNTSSNTKSFIHLYQKILKGYKKRALQVEKVKQYIHSNEKDKILCCDLNDVPSSFSYKSLSEDLSDAFKESGFGISHTTHVTPKIFRIDYILGTENIQFNSYKRVKNQYSDHNMIVSYFKTEESE